MSYDRELYTRKRKGNLAVGDKGLLVIPSKSSIGFWSNPTTAAAFFYDPKEATWAVIVDNNYRDLTSASMVTKNQLDAIIEKKKENEKERNAQIYRDMKAMVDPVYKKHGEIIKKALPSFDVSYTNTSGVLTNVRVERLKLGNPSSVEIMISSNGFGKTDLTAKISLWSGSIESASEAPPFIKAVEEASKVFPLVEAYNKDLQKVFKSKEFQEMSAVSGVSEWQFT